MLSASLDIFALNVLYMMATLTCNGYFDAQWLLWLLGRAMAT